MSTGRPLRVLVIDDEVRVCQLYASAASRLDWDVAAARDGSTGLALARARTFDVILLDLRMPGVSGLAVLQALRTGGNWTPVVIYTAYPDTDSALEAGRWGVIQYLEKPMRLRAMNAALRAAAAQAAGPPTAARREEQAARSASVWARATAWAATPIDREGEPDAAQASQDLLDLFVEAAQDGDGTTLAQFAILARVARVALGEPEALPAAAQAFRAVAAAATAVGEDRAAPLAARLLGPFATPFDLDEPALAGHVAMHPATVRRQLSDLFGCPFHELRWAALIRRAVAPAARSAEPIGNIAIDGGCGTEPSRLRHVERAWIGLLGVSASRFRARCARR